VALGKESFHTGGNVPPNLSGPARLRQDETQVRGPFGIAPDVELGINLSLQFGDVDRELLLRRFHSEAIKTGVPMPAEYLALRRSQRAAGLFGELEMRTINYERRSSQPQCCSVRCHQRTGFHADSAGTADATARSVRASRLIDTHDFSGERPVLGPNHETGSHRILGRVPAAVL
jgi:hypothetical protein